MSNVGQSLVPSPGAKMLIRAMKRTTESDGFCISFSS